MKELWQMTREEFRRQSFITEVAPGFADIRAPGETIRVSSHGRERKSDAHEVIIRDALQQGKPVPSKVLADYQNEEEPL